jgi:hypothetical protein
MRDTAGWGYIPIFVSVPHYVRVPSRWRKSPVPLQTSPQVFWQSILKVGHIRGTDSSQPVPQFVSRPIANVSRSRGFLPRPVIRERAGVRANLDNESRPEIPGPVPIANESRPGVSLIESRF